MNPPNTPTTSASANQDPAVANVQVPNGIPMDPQQLFTMFMQNMFHSGHRMMMENGQFVMPPGAPQAPNTPVSGTDSPSEPSQKRARCADAPDDEEKRLMNDYVSRKRLDNAMNLLEEAETKLIEKENELETLRQKHQDAENLSNKKIADLEKKLNDAESKTILKITQERDSAQKELEKAMELVETQKKDFILKDKTIESMKQTINQLKQDLATADTQRKADFNEVIASIIALRDAPRAAPQEPEIPSRSSTVGLGSSSSLQNPRCFKDPKDQNVELIRSPYFGRLNPAAAISRTFLHPRNIEVQKKTFAPTSQTPRAYKVPAPTAGMCKTITKKQANTVQVVKQELEANPIEDVKTTLLEKRATIEAKDPNAPGPSSKK